MVLLLRIVLVLVLTSLLLSSDLNDDQGTRASSKLSSSSGDNGEKLAIPIQAPLTDYILEIVVCPEMALLEWVQDIANARHTRLSIIWAEMGRRRLEIEFARKLDALNKRCR